MTSRDFNLLKSAQQKIFQYSQSILNPSGSFGHQKKLRRSPVKMLYCQTCGKDKAMHMCSNPVMVVRPQYSGTHFYLHPDGQFRTTPVVPGVLDSPRAHTSHVRFCKVQKE